jgi:hypothetical protein
MKSMRLLPMLLLLTACQRAAAPPAPAAPVAPPASAAAENATAAAAAMPAAPAPTVSASLADAWLGTWTGPEGTSLEIGHDGAGYALKITSLDGPGDYYGIGTPAGISFERNGTTEALHAGTGAETGMKWLAGKSDCLVVRAGEGYCRD